MWDLDKAPNGEGKQALGKGQEGKEKEDARVGGSDKRKTGNIASSAGAVVASGVAGSRDGGKTTICETSRKKLCRAAKCLQRPRCLLQFGRETTGMGSIDVK